MKIKQTCSAVLVLFASMAQAQWYGEIGVTPLTVKSTVEGNTLKSKPSMLGVVLGYEAHPNLAIEGMAGTNIDADSISLNGVEVPGTRLKIKHAYGFFLKPKVMLTPEVELFGRLGWVENKSSGQVNGYSLTDTDNDTAYGLGMNYYFNKTTYGSLSYTQFYDKQNTRTRGATLSVGMKF